MNRSRGFLYCGAPTISPIHQLNTNLARARPYVSREVMEIGGLAVYFDPINLCARSLEGFAVGATRVAVMSFVSGLTMIFTLDGGAPQCRGMFLTFTLLEGVCSVHSHPRGDTMKESTMTQQRVLAVNGMICDGRERRIASALSAGDSRDGVSADREDGTVTLQADLDVTRSVA